MSEEKKKQTNKSKDILLYFQHPFDLLFLTSWALSYVMEVANSSMYAMRQCAEVENFMTSFERIMAFTNLDSEPGYNTEMLSPINWPYNDHVSFQNVVLRYYPGGPQVLKNLSFVIQRKTKLGIVGRTVDGKSSIVAALLRMPEAEGEICIDNVCIDKLLNAGVKMVYFCS